MNLKEAFRFQNKLQSLIDEVQRILEDESNITEVKITYYRHRVNPDAEDETTLSPASSEFSEHITELVNFADYLLIEKYSKVCPNLKNVVIPIDYVNLFQDDFDVDGAPDWNRSIYYNLYMDIKKYGTMSKFHYELSCPRYMISKIFRYTWSKFNGKFYDIGCDSLGRGTDYLLNGVEKHIDSVIFTRQNNMNYDILSKTKGLNLNHLRRIKSLCSKRKIRLIAVHTPCWHSYNENLDSARLLLLEEGIEYAKNFLRIDYYDYRDDRRFCYTNHFFFDTHHLSEFGADFFTDLIKKDANI